MRIFVFVFFLLGCNSNIEGNYVNSLNNTVDSLSIYRKETSNSVEYIYRQRIFSNYDSNLLIDNSGKVILRDGEVNFTHYYVNHDNRLTSQLKEERLDILCMDIFQVKIQGNTISLGPLGKYDKIQEN
ncbi:hypothetical protein [Persicobacter diffluens]|uniref:Uncharacterized protein n=1 Tax=Persicobacter diffluens TaxID=981 RepID=A0AAN4W2U1_9BACT|nr:hypothetical protein PEDI_41550 [Persicobacter diffluens]